MTPDDSTPTGRSSGVARELIGLLLLAVGTIGFLAVVASFSPAAALALICLLAAASGAALVFAPTEE